MLCMNVQRRHAIREPLQHAQIKVVIVKLINQVRKHRKNFNRKKPKQFETFSWEPEFLFSQSLINCHPSFKHVQPVQGLMATIPPFTTFMFSYY